MKDLFLSFIEFFNTSKIVQYLLFISFTLITYFLLRGHVLYRDDARPLLIAFYEQSFPDLYKAMLYDGGPILYHLILWKVAKFVHLSPFIVKAIHFFIQILILYTLIFLIRIPNTIKLLILLQAPFIGYTMYVRRYTLAVLFIFLFAYLYTNQKVSKGWIYLTLFLLSQTCPHGLFISFAFFLFLVINKYCEKKEIFSSYYLIPITGFLLAIPQMIQPSDVVAAGTHHIKPLFTDATLDFLILLLYHTFLNNYVIGITFFCIMIFITISTLKKDRTTGISFLLCITILFSLFFLLGALKYPSQDRHNWLLSYSIISFLIILSSKLNFKYSKLIIFQLGVVVLLFISFYNFTSLIPKAKRLSSNGQNVACFLERNFADKEILAKYELFIEPVIIYRKKYMPYFALGRQQYVKYCVTNHTSTDFTKFKDLITVLKYSELINDLSNTPDKILKKEPIIILASHEYINDLNIPLEEVKINKTYSLKFLKEFNGAKYDNYILYQIKKI